MSAQSFRRYFSQYLVELSNRAKDYINSYRHVFQEYQVADDGVTLLVFCADNYDANYYKKVVRRVEATGTTINFNGVGYGFSYTPLENTAPLLELAQVLRANQELLPLRLFHYSSDVAVTLLQELRAIRIEINQGFQSMSKDRRVFNNPIKAKDTADPRHSLATFTPMELFTTNITSNSGLITFFRYLRTVVCPRPCPLLVKVDINLHYRALRVCCAEWIHSVLCTASPKYCCFKG
jgi:hypothetical protein